MQNCGTAVTQEGRHRCELQTDSEVSKGSREQKAAPWSAGDYTGHSRRADGHTERGELGRTLKRRVSEAGNSSGDTRKKAGLGSPVREVWTWCGEPRCVLEHESPVLRGCHMTTVGGQLVGQTRSGSNSGDNRWGGWHSSMLFFRSWSTSLFGISGFCYRCPEPELFTYLSWSTNKLTESILASPRSVISVKS